MYPRLNMDAPGFGELVSEFAFDPPWVLAALAAATWYAVLVRRSNRAGLRRHPLAAQAAFYGGLVLVLVAALSPVEHWGNQLLWVNFLGFLILSMFAAPLLVLGAPLTLAFRASDRPGRRRLRWFYRRSPFSLATYPIFAWLFFAIVTYAWQFTALTEQAATNVFLRDIQLLTVLLASVLFWIPALQADPVRWRLGYPLRFFYVMLEMVHKGLFGGMFLSLNTPFHEQFAANLPAWAPSAMTDQRMAILVLWIGGNTLFLVALGYIVSQWLAYDARDNHRTDRRLALQRAARNERRKALERVFEKTV
jgi:putative copper resistance protein D